jgi:NET1-associated nuclear protein 1 (U3 small nucleolar RNA-associated protein 17)
LKFRRQYVDLLFVCFSTINSEDGAYLLSGGEEAVLVMWQLDTGHRQFLPRLGAPITGIAVGPRGAQYALSCGDNAVRIIGAVSSKVERVVRGLQCAATATSFPTDELNTCGLAIDSRTGHVLVGGLPGSLQLYDSVRSRHVAEVPVVARQHVSRTESNNNSAQKSQTRPSVRLTSWHTSGDWLSTVEGRFLKSSSNTNALLPVPGTTDGEESDELMVLKFWRVIRDQQGTTFSLNTRIDQPHKSRVTCVAFHPTRALCVTSSIDRTFKVWRREAKPAPPRPAGSDAPAPAAQEYWLCQSVGFYRHEPINHVAFSPDGSILSVCSGATISLWDPETMQLLRTLSVSTSEQETLRASHFVPGSPCLIAHTSTSIMVWNLLTLQLWWQHTVPSGSNISVRALATHSSGHFVAYLDAPTDNNDRPTASVLLDFHIGSPRPARAVLSPALLAGGSETVPVIMFDNTDSLLALTAAHELIKLPHFLDPQAPVVPAESSVSDAASVVARLTAEQPVSLFQRLYGGATAASTTSQQPAAQPVSTSSLSSGASHFSSLFSAPTHVVPSMTSLFAAFMQALVKPVSAAAATASSNSVSDAANNNASTSSTITSTSTMSATVNDDDALFRSETALGLFQWNSQSYLDIVRPQAAAAQPASKKAVAAESIAPVKSSRKVAAVEVESVEDEARDTVSALPAGRKRKVAAAATADSDVSDSEGGRPRRSTRAGRASDSELSDSSAPKVPARRGRPPRA